jgi:hypothetical protein
MLMVKPPFHHPHHHHLQNTIQVENKYTTIFHLENNKDYVQIKHVTIANKTMHPIAST